MLYVLEEAVEHVSSAGAAGKSASCVTTSYVRMEVLQPGGEGSATVKQLTCRPRAKYLAQQIGGTVGIPDDNRVGTIRVNVSLDSGSGVTSISEALAEMLQGEVHGSTVVPRFGGRCKCAYLIRGEPGGEAADFPDLFEAAHPVETCPFQVAVRRAPRAREARNFGEDNAAGRLGCGGHIRHETERAVCGHLRRRSIRPSPGVLGAMRTRHEGLVREASRKRNQRRPGVRRIQ